MHWRAAGPTCTAGALRGRHRADAEGEQQQRHEPAHGGARRGGIGLRPSGAAEARLFITLPVQCWRGIYSGVYHGPTLLGRGNMGGQFLFVLVPLEALRQRHIGAVLHQTLNEEQKLTWLGG